MTDSIEPSRLEIEKWEFEKAARERELRLKEREQATKEGELELKRAEHDSAQWRNPLVVAVFAAAVAAAGNAVVSYTNGNSQRELEAQKAEEARILEMIKTGNPDKAAENLRFLVEAGLITDTSLRKRVTTFLENRKPGSGPTLPSAAAFLRESRTSYECPAARARLVAGSNDSVNVAYQGHRCEFSVNGGTQATGISASCPNGNAIAYVMPKGRAASAIETSGDCLIEIAP